MDSSRRLQQLQQANSHLAPLSAPQLAPTNAIDYRPRSPLFPQISSQAYNNSDGCKTPLLQQYPQDVYERRYEEYERSMAAAPLLLKQQPHHHHHENDQQQQQLQQHPYQAAPMMRAPSQQFHQHQMYQQFPNHQHNHNHNLSQHNALPPQPPLSPPPTTQSLLPNSTSNSSISSRSHQQPLLLQEQYRQLQRARTQQRIECQARAALNQQRTFAARQAALAAASGNPAIACASPVPSVVVSVTPVSNSGTGVGNRVQGEDGFDVSTPGARKPSGIDSHHSDNQNYMPPQNHRRPDGAQQENPMFSAQSNRRVPGVDNSQQNMYPNNRRPGLENAQQDNQQYPRSAQIDFNQRRQMENMQQDNNALNYMRRTGAEDNQIFMPNRRQDNQENHGQVIRRTTDDANAPVVPPGIRKVDGSENQKVTGSNNCRDNVRSPVTVMQPPPISASNSRREVLPPNASSVATRERMQSPVPTINLSQQQAPQVPPKPSAQTARQAQHNLYVQPHPNNGDQSIISPIGSPGAPTYASSPANQTQNSPQKYSQGNLYSQGPTVNNQQQQYYNQQGNVNLQHSQVNQSNQPVNSNPFYQSNQSSGQSNEQISSQPSTPYHQPLTQPQRSKSIASSITSSISSNSIMVRGPIARRPMDSVVTISGWLHKQGCDGLKVWRKRWFVLTDYCLFYYKGQEEEKLLGSILLPSYTVSICTPDEKHHRRNSFKCEHANMRTYVLAADTPEAMALWVRALRDACTMQCDESSHQSQPSVSNSDTSTSLQQQAISAPVPQVLNQQQQQHMISQQQQQQILNQQQQMLNQQQPLYANAPHRVRSPNEPQCYSPVHGGQERYDESAYGARPQSRRMHQEMARSPIPSDAIYETQQQLQGRLLQQQQNMAPNVSNLHPGFSHSYTMDHNAQKQHQAFLSSQRQNAYSKTMPAPGHGPVRELRSPYDMESSYMPENTENIIRAPRRFQNPNEEYEQYTQQNVTNAAQTSQLRTVQKSNERRTPDTYGRSRHARQQYAASINAANAMAVTGCQIDAETSAMQQSAPSNAGDYEDLYNGYKRPMSPAPNSPTSSTGLGNLNPQSRAELERRGIILPHGYNDEQSAAPVQLRHKQNKRQLNAQSQNPYQTRRNVIPRPHSADFLEYETKASSNQNSTMSATSAHNINQNSIPVNNNAISGGDYGSSNRSARDRLMRQRPKSSLDMPIGDQMYYSEKSYAEMMRQSALYVDAVKSGGIDGANRQRILGGGRMYEDNNAGNEIPNKSHSIHLSNDVQNYDEEIREMSHYSQNRDFVNSYSVPRQGRDQHIDGSNQFARSASARLFRNNKDQDEPLEQGAKKVQQREESMKRLLEWKQRMLQAPLSRSTTGVIDAGSATAINPSSNVNRTMSPAPMISDSNGGLNSTKQRQSSYNSYSSDDEASLTNKLGVYPKASTLPMRAVSPRLRLSQETLLQTDKYTQKLNGNEYSTTKTDYDKYYSRNLYDSDLINSDPNSGKFMYKEDQDRYGSKQGLIRDYDAEYGSREMFVDAEYGSRDNLLGTNHGEYDSNYLSRTGEDWSRLRRSGSQVDDLNFIDRDQINRSRLGKSIDDSKQREENLQKLNALKHHLLELEKQYEKGKPLVNLVDNMVKLGALYKGNAKPTNQRHNGGYLNDKLEFNQRLEERRLMKEEQKYWDSANVDEQQLQNKMRQLQEYSDQLREQSNTLQGLRKDEESLRGALASLKTRMQQGQQLKQTHSTMNSAAGRAELLEKAREQERALERELTKVRELLVNNSKKLENTLSANSRAEDELRVMTHRFQESKTNNGSQQQLLFMGNMNSNTNGTSNNQTDSVPYAGGATALLESELRRVQEVVGDIQRQRQELSLAVRELTDRSQYVDRDVLPKQTLTSNASIKKRPQATWLETDLDLMITLEHGINIESDEQTKNNLYKNMINNTTSNNGCNLNVESRNVEDDEDSGSENKALGALNANSQERSEVKTVRIVKRESERRHRDRNEKTQSWNYTSNLDHVMEEETNRPKSVFENDLTSISSSNQQRPYSYAQQYSRNAINNSNYPSNASTSFLGVSNNIYTSNNYSSDNLSSRDLLNENNLILSKYNSADHFSSSQNLYGKSEFPSSQNLYGSRDLKNLSKCESIVSLSKSAELSPVFHSQAAKDIISTININDVKTEDKYNSKSEVMIHKRQVPKEKRRHYTAPTNDINMKGVANMDGSYSNGGTTDLSYSKEQYDYRACDDLDMERALRTKSTDDSTTIISSGSNSNAPDLVRSTIQDSELLLSNTSYSKNHNGDYMYGSSYVNNADQKITYRNTNISDSIERKYNYLTPNSNKDDNYMDMTYSSKNTKSALKQDDNFSSKNLFYNKFDYGSENYVSKTRSSALDDTPISSSRKPEFIETSKDYLHTRTFSDKNVCDDDSYTYHSKDSKLAADGKYFSNEKKIDDNLCSDSVADKETSSDVPVKKDSRFSDNTIDKLLAAPSKILIPERYIPEKAPELTPEELERRQQKAESIRKMLSTTSITPTANNTTNQEGQVTTNEKRQREHLLQLNQILAKEVMEMSKIVAGSNTNSTLQ